MSKLWNSTDLSQLLGADGAAPVLVKHLECLPYLLHAEIKGLMNTLSQTLFSDVPHLLHLLGCHCRGAGVTVAGLVLVLVLRRDDDRRRVVPVHFALEMG